MSLHQQHPNEAENGSGGSGHNFHPNDKTNSCNHHDTEKRKNDNRDMQKSGDDKVDLKYGSFKLQGNQMLDDENLEQNEMCDLHGLNCRCDLSEKDLEIVSNSEKSRYDYSTEQSPNNILINREHSTYSHPNYSNCLEIMCEDSSIDIHDCNYSKPKNDCSKFIKPNIRDTECDRNSRSNFYNDCNNPVQMYDCAEEERDFCVNEFHELLPCKNQTSQRQESSICSKEPRKNKLYNTYCASIFRLFVKHVCKDETFLVLASRLGKVYIYRFNKEKSLWTFGPKNPLRRAIIYLITNQLFEVFVILTILVNCVFLALENAPEEAEYIFTAIYTVEMILKIIAKGFALHSFAYLRDPWNWLDFIVVMLGYCTLAPKMANLSGIRTFRVLRALRTISAIEGLKTMVNALLKSMRMLSDVLILTAFFICVFALVGLQLFSGQFHNKCVKNDLYRGSNQTWMSAIQNESNWYEPIKICGNSTGALSCPPNFTCQAHAGVNPNSGFTSYDNFGWALLTSVQIVTLDFWEDVYFHTASALGPWYIFYFIIVVFFGSFYLINLVLAVVTVSYQQETSLDKDLESQYEFLRDITSLYSLNKRFLPELIYDDPVIDNISNLPYVKNGPSVIIISRSKKKKELRTNMDNSITGCHHNIGRDSSEKSSAYSSKSDENSSKVIRNKLTSIINKIKHEREKDNEIKEIEELENRSIQNDESATTVHRINLANVRESAKLSNENNSLDVDRSMISSGQNRTHVKFLELIDTTDENNSNNNKTDNPRSNTSELKSKTTSRLTSSRRPTHNIENPLPYADIHPSELTYPQIFRRRVYRFVMSPWFELGVTIVILLNTICLAIEYHGMNKKLRNSLDLANHIFTGIFILEMLLKLIALGLFGYVKGVWNVFDGLVVLMSIVDLIIEFLSSSDNSDFTIIRSLRLFRVLKLAQSWSTMRLLLSAIGRSLNALGNLTLILGIIVYMFAVVGTQVFGNQYNTSKFRDNKVPVWNFSNFGHSIMMIFRVLCGEWIEPLYDCMQATGTWSVAFYITALVVGNFLVLNLFLALLLNSFADQAMEEELKKKSFIKSKLKWVSSTRKLAKLQKALSGQKIDPNSNLSLASAAKLAIQQKRDNENPSQTTDIDAKSTAASTTVAIEDNKTKEKFESITLDSTEGFTQFSFNVPNFNTIKRTDPDTTVDDRELSVDLAQSPNYDQNKPNKPKSPNQSSNGLSSQTLSPAPSLFSSYSRITETNRSLSSSITVHYREPIYPKLVSCCLSNGDRSQSESCWQKFRSKVKKLIQHKWFDNVILALIFASSFVLVFEDIHLSSRPQLEKALYVLNIVFSILFFVECALKVIGIGPKQYIKNPWNLLDFSIVVVSITSIIMEAVTTKGGNLKTLRSLRTLRALRPLRAVSRWDGMKIVVNSLLKAIPSIGNVLLVCLMFWLIFSILGVQFFGGKFYKCLDKEGERIDASDIPNKTACLANNYTWKNSDVNFDNALKGFLPLFQVATFEGWIEVMRDSVDATEIDQQPVRDNNFPAYFYYVVFIIVGAFFILNLFISVIIDNFYRLKKQYDDGGTVEVFLTTEQKQWFSTVKKALTKKPKKILKRPTNYYQSRLFDFVISTKFEMFTMLMILVNIVLMMFQHYQQSDAYTHMLYIVNLVFTGIFMLELLLRMTALRREYFADRWNWFDIVILLFSAVGIILESMDVVMQVTPSVLRVARVLRIGRLLRYFNSAKGIRRLLVALIISLPALFNIGALLFLILFIYAIIGMSNFGYVKRQGAINEIVNFETFGNSMLVLFRLSTSAGWNEVLEPLMIQPPNCEENYKEYPNGNCGNPLVAVVFFVTFILITYLIIVNMYIAVILENFNQANEQDEIGITDEDIEMFYAVWQLYDPLATQFIEFEKLQYLVANLGPPLGISMPNKVAVHNLNLPMNENDQIHCIDVLQALLRRVLGHIDNTETEHYEKMRSTIDRKLQAAFPIRQKETHKTTTMERFQQVNAAIIIQKHFRSWRMRKSQPLFNSPTHLVNDDKRKISAVQRILSNSRLNRTLSSISIRSPFARKKNSSKELVPYAVELQPKRSLSSYMAIVPNLLTANKRSLQETHSSPSCFLPNPGSLTVSKFDVFNTETTSKSLNDLPNSPLHITVNVEPCEKESITMEDSVKKGNENTLCKNTNEVDLGKTLQMEETIIEKTIQDSGTLKESSTDSAQHQDNQNRKDSNSEECTKDDFDNACILIYNQNAPSTEYLKQEKDKTSNNLYDGIMKKPLLLENIPTEPLILSDSDSPRPLLAPEDKNKDLKKGNRSEAYDKPTHACNSRRTSNNESKILLDYSDSRKDFCDSTTDNILGNVYIDSGADVNKNESDKHVSVTEPRTKKEKELIESNLSLEKKSPSLLRLNENDHSTGEWSAGNDSFKSHRSDEKKRRNITKKKNTLKTIPSIVAIKKNSPRLSRSDESLDVTNNNHSNTKTVNVSFDEGTGPDNYLPCDRMEKMRDRMTTDSGIVSDASMLTSSSSFSLACLPSRSASPVQEDPVIENVML